MDIKYKVTKLKNNNIEEVKDSVSVEEPLEMILRFETNGKWKNENISITMRTPGTVSYTHLTLPTKRIV